jgi:threonine aldolase
MKRPIEMRSDTFTLPTQAMLEAIPRAELGDDVYGEDPTVRRLEELAARKVGMEAAILMPSGTMANLTSLMAHCPRGARVLVGSETDIYVYEAGGASVCGGIVYEPIPNEPDGRLQRGALEEALAVDAEDPQFALPALICLENPHNRCGGAILPLSYLQVVREMARAHGLPIHLDGARLFNAAVALGVEPARITEHVDSLQFCLSKGLSAPIGSMVAGSREFIRKVHRLRKMLGGGMRQAGIIAAAGIVALEQMVDRLAEDHANARRLAKGLSALPGIALASEPVINLVFFRVVDGRFTWQSFVEATRRRGLNLGELGHGRIRASTHSGISEADVDAALEIIREVLRAGPERS